MTVDIWCNCQWCYIYIHVTSSQLTHLIFSPNQRDCRCHKLTIFQTSVYKVRSSKCPLPLFIITVKTSEWWWWHKTLHKFWGCELKWKMLFFSYTICIWYIYKYTEYLIFFILIRLLIWSTLKIHFVSFVQKLAGYIVAFQDGNSTRTESYPVYLQRR